MTRFLAAAAVLALACGNLRAGTIAPLNLAGQWVMNRDLSSAPGGAPSPDGGRRRPGGGPGMIGGGGGRPGGGGFGMGGARGGAGPARPSPEDMEQQRALLQEVMTLPGRLTIAQDADKVTFIEPDGVSRSYLVNGKTEKHQLTRGTIETRSSWDDGALKMEIAVGGQTRVVRRFAVRAGPRRLEVATTFDGAPRDTQRLTVYEEAAPPGY